MPGVVDGRPLTVVGFFGTKNAPSKYSNFLQETDKAGTYLLVRETFFTFLPAGESLCGTFETPFLRQEFLFLCFLCFFHARRESSRVESVPSWARSRFWLAVVSF